MAEPMHKAGKSNVSCHVTFGESKAIVSAEPEKLLERIQQKFGLKRDAFYLQMFLPDWNEWVDVLPEDIPNTSKLKVILHSGSQYGKNASSSESLPNEEPIGSSSCAKSTKVVEGEKLPEMPGRFSKILISNVNHPLLSKLRKGERLDKKENAELVKKVFHMISEITFFPSPSNLALYVKTLLREFPVLKSDNPTESKRHWISHLRNKFTAFRQGIARKEQKPKVCVSTQTDNIPSFQDMSPIMLAIKQEYLKPVPDQEKIERFMCLTYQYRRAFIINMVPKVMAIQEMYPALFNHREIRNEFLRITGKDSDKMFFSNLEKYGRIVYDLVKGCSARCFIDPSIQAAKNKKVRYNWKNACLLLMPFLFKENLSFLWFEKEKFNAEQDEPYIKCNAVRETVTKGGGFFQVYAENNTLLAETGDFAIAMECFLASFFIFMIEYRSDLKKTLQLLQSFFFEYDDPDDEDLHPRVIEVAEKLKNKMKQQAHLLKS